MFDRILGRKFLERFQARAIPHSATPGVTIWT